MNSSKHQLAIFGGPKAVQCQRPHWTWPLITEKTEAAVVAQMRESISIYNRSGVFARFEDAWSKYHGLANSLVTSSGTAGLWSAFVGCDLKDGDEVIVPAYTFYATATPLFQTGAIPVLVDAGEDGNIDPAAIEAAITGRTKAIAVTHMWGVPVRMDEVMRIARKYNLRVVEDCSHAHGASYLHTKVGAWGDVGVWSLQGQKIVTGGEGGVVSTNDHDIYSRATLLGQYNKRSLQTVPTDHPLRDYCVTGFGMKLRATPMNIAMALEQFGHLDEWLDWKRYYAARMTTRLSGLPGIEVPRVPEGADPAWYAYVFRYTGPVPVERFAEALKAEGASEVDLPRSTCPLSHLPLFQDPTPMFPAYQNLGYKPGMFPVAERFFEQAVKLPVWTSQGDAELVEQYCDAIEKVALAKF